MANASELFGLVRELKTRIHEYEQDPTNQIKRDLALDTQLQLKTSYDSPPPAILFPDERVEVEYYINYKL